MKNMNIKFNIGDIYIIQCKHLYASSVEVRPKDRPCVLLGTYGKDERPLFLQLTTKKKTLKNAKIEDKSLRETSYCSDHFTLLSAETNKPTTLMRMEPRKVNRLSEESIKQVKKYLNGNKIVQISLKKALKLYDAYEMEVSSTNRYAESNEVLFEETVEIDLTETLAY